MTDDPIDGAAAEPLRTGSDRILAAFDFAAGAAEQDARHHRQLTSVVDALLEVMDTFDRVLAAVGDGAVPVETSAAIARRIETLLESLGVSSTTTVGAPVDLQTDEIIEVQDSVEPDGVVVEVVTRGYEWDGRLHRRARVVVARNPRGEAR
jgi:molecular chaperone GrpE (heat shock protein)